MKSALGNGVQAMGSQVLNSGSNLLLAILVANAVATDQLGMWSIAYAGAVLAVQVFRAMVSTPLLVHDEVDRDIPAHLLRQAWSAAIALGLIGCVVFLVAAAFLTGDAARTVLVFGLGLPFLALQDTIRYAAIRSNQAWRAVVIDAVWVAGQVLGWIALYAADELHAWTISGTWVLGAALSAVIGLAWSRVGFGPRAAAVFFRSEASAATKLVAETVIGTGVLQLLPPLIAIASTLTVAGGMRAAQTVFGLLTFLVMGLAPVVTSVAVQRYRRGASVAGLLHLVNLATTAAAGGLLVVLVLLPEVGDLLAGNTWPDVETILIPTAIAAALRGPFAGVPMLLRARREFNALLLLRVRTAFPALAGPALGAGWYGLEGAAWGLVIAAAVNAAQSLAAYLRHGRS